MNHQAAIQPGRPGPQASSFPENDGRTLCREVGGAISLTCMITPKRLHEICRFYDLLAARVAESSEPLTMLQRQVVVDMMGELIEHAKETATA
ncbi:hypothetical protein GCM10009767_35350 [Kocuria aegyptia]|uniref:Uncharacterized protein n=2 Tax=Kocuria aegyptia TaxID=330943 RepID=A0ABP4XCI6_9MICC